MFSQFFGNYLLENDLVTKKELSEVLAAQDKARVKLGVLAVNLGFMAADEIDKVHEKQATEDKLFGELAVELGYLTEDELEEVLSTQKKEHLLMSQTLVDKGFMTLQELEKAIADYKEDNKLTDEEFKALKDNNVEKIVDAFLDFGSVEDDAFYKDYAVLLVNNLVRFISSKLRLKGLEMVNKYEVDWGAYQKIHGDKILFTAAAAQADEFVRFAEIYADMEFEQPDELVCDSVAEFINLQNGIFTVNSSDSGIKLEMKPQSSLENRSFDFLEKAYVISIEFEFGKVDFIMSNEIPKIK